MYESLYDFLSNAKYKIPFFTITVVEQFTAFYLLVTPNQIYIITLFFFLRFRYVTICLLIYFFELLTKFAYYVLDARSKKKILALVKCDRKTGNIWKSYSSHEQVWFTLARRTLNLWSIDRWTRGGGIYLFIFLI